MNTQIIAIAGGTGSGKSFLANSLLNMYPKEEMLIIRQDSYYKALPNLNYKDRSNQNFDHPDAIDSILIENHLKKLLSGDTIYCPIYDFTKHLRKKSAQKVKPRPFIIIEGILMLHYTRLLDFYSLKVFIETPEAVRIKRRIDRDIRSRGRTLKSIENQYYSTVKPMHEKYVQPSKSFSDIVLDGTDLVDNLIREIKTEIGLVSK
tara:strand:+ start:332 stop:946 length:615 start_codon:yes stop_codon:yes gene_type:complete